MGRHNVFNRADAGVMLVTSRLRLYVNQMELIKFMEIRYLSHLVKTIYLKTWFTQFLHV
jgi:hypothetical protein